MARLAGLVTKTDFTPQVLERLRIFLSALPDKCAEVEVTEDRNPEARVAAWHFRVSPTNTRSARIQGLVDSSFGIYFTVGEGASAEIFLASWSNKSNQTEADRFFAICRAVVTTSFSEELTRSSHNSILRSNIVFRIDGKTIRIRCQRIFWWLYPRRTTMRFSYEPYY